ncbi:uncharacterized protein LOC134777739 [Penaeus indicus]|uniref:uncharacterized protein LOC134777739 n=1 Tax=Penaeus indicus TaxID=29960 RepID=UPI00300C1C43
MASPSDWIPQSPSEVDWRRYDGQEVKVAIGRVLLGFKLNVGADVANPLRPPAPDRGFPTVRGILVVKVPYDLANIDREATGLQLASLGVVLTAVFLLLAIMSSPLALLLDSLANSARETQTVDEALRQVSWAKLLKSLDLEEGWAALHTPANCREKVVCEVHRLLRRASPHSLRLVKAFVPHLSGTSKYRKAATAGLGGRDFQMENNWNIRLLHSESTYT